MLAAARKQLQHIDLKHHVRHSSIFFRKPDFTGPKCFILNYLKNFNAVVSSSPCFGSGHTAIYNSQPVPLDVQFPKLYKSIAGPPPEVDWNEAGKEVLIYGMSGSEVFFFFKCTR